MRYMTTISNSAIGLKIRVSKRSKYDIVSREGRHGRVRRNRRDARKSTTTRSPEHDHHEVTDSSQPLSLCLFNESGL